MNISSSPNIPRPISMHNYLLSISLHLGIPRYDENRMRILVDTSAVVNTAN